MSRYILIDRYSGFIWGDSATFDKQFGSAIEFARAIDESLKNHGRTYSLAYEDNASVYFVYIAEESFPAIKDGQDKDEINAVINNCDYICFIIAKQEE